MLPPHGQLVTNDQSRLEHKGPVSMLQFWDNFAGLCWSQSFPCNQLSLWCNHILLNLLLCLVLPPVLPKSASYAYCMQISNKSLLPRELAQTTPHRDNSHQILQQVPIHTSQNSEALRPSLDHRPHVTILCGTAVYCDITH